MPITRSIQLAVLIVPAVILCLLPPLVQVLFRPSLPVMAAVAAVAVAALLVYPVLLLSWRRSRLRRAWLALRFRWEMRRQLRPAGRHRRPRPFQRGAARAGRGHR